MRATQRRSVAVLHALALALALGACGTSARSAAPVVSSIPTTTTAAPANAVPTTVAATVTAPATTTTAASRATTAATTATTTAATTTTVLPAEPRLGQVGEAGQAIVVTAAGYGTTTATLTAYERGAGGWRAAFGPWTARVGSAGLAPPGAKREGDGRTPSGVYGFDFMFGVAPDPGVRFPYRPITSRSLVWDDDPASPLYNTLVDTRRQDAGAAPEPMYVSPAYDHGAVIAYNATRTSGLGSAIFLHVSTGAATAGCVSLPAAQLVELLRWLDPARNPRIVLGVAA